MFNFFYGTLVSSYVRLSYISWEVATRIVCFVSRKEEGPSRVAYSRKYQQLFLISAALLF